MSFGVLSKNIIVEPNSYRTRLIIVENQLVEHPGPVVQLG